MSRNDDLINRKAAIDALGKEGLVTAMVIIDRVPSVQQVAKDINVLSNGLISRKEAIDQLHQSYNLFDAERRLEDMPPAQPEPFQEKSEKWVNIAESLLDGKDGADPIKPVRLIDANALTDSMSNYIFYSENDRAMVCDIIRISPTIERKHGRWVHRGCGVFECDQCGELVSTNAYKAEKASDRFKFCSSCGADMRGSEQDV